MSDRQEYPSYNGEYNRDPEYGFKKKLKKKGLYWNKETQKWEIREFDDRYYL